MEVHNPLSVDIEMQHAAGIGIIAGPGKDEVIENFRDDDQKKITMDVSHLSYSMPINNRYKTLLQDVNFSIPHVSKTLIMFVVVPLPYCVY